MELYKRIRQRREELGMTQDELANLMGYKSRSSINKIELGKSDIPQSKIKAFAKALQTTPEHIMGLDSDTIENDDPDYICTFKFDEILDDYVHKVGEFLYYNPTHKKIIDASMQIETADVDFAAEMLRRISHASASNTESSLLAAHEDINASEDDKKADIKLLKDYKSNKKDN